MLPHTLWLAPLTTFGNVCLQLISAPLGVCSRKTAWSECNQTGGNQPCICSVPARTVQLSVRCHRAELFCRLQTPQMLPLTAFQMVIKTDIQCVHCYSLHLICFTTNSCFCFVLYVKVFASISCSDFHYGNAQIEMRDNGNGKIIVDYFPLRIQENVCCSCAAFNYKSPSFLSSPL